MKSPLRENGTLRVLTSYGAMLLVAVVAFFFIRRTGESLPSPPPPAAGARAVLAAHSDTLAHVLLALAVVCFMARLVGGLLRRYLHQPPVIGEIVAGLMLGPSLLGLVWPEGYAFLLPPAVAPFLGLLAKIGVVLFMFVVGLELDSKLLRGNARATVVIAHASIVVPFLLGASLAMPLYSSYSTSDVSFTVFSLFLGIAMSITAFPVLARVLGDREAMQTPLGTTALACAAIGDVTAWSLLAVIVGIATSQLSAALWTLTAVAGYVAVMLFIVRPGIRFLVEREDRLEGPPRRTTLAVTFVLLLLSAFATEWIGIHALFGAFLFGALMPHDGRLSGQLKSSLGDVVVVLLLPAFFALTGMRTQLGLLDQSSEWLVCGAIILVATMGKFGGSAVAARLTGMSWRDSSTLGILMNTRGLMELIVLNLGLDLGVITPTVFTMMVLMALFTTFMATPALDFIHGREGFRAAPASSR